MRGLLAALPVVLLGTGCIYLDEPNFAPTIAVQPSREGPYYRGDAIGVTATLADRNPGEADKLTTTWTLTDATGAALPGGAWTECEPAAPSCFVPHRLGITYRMTGTAKDERGALSTGAVDFVVENRAPIAALDARGVTWPEDGHYRLLSPIAFTPLGSTDPDADDRCALTYAFANFDARPLLSQANLEACPADDVRPGCPTPVPTRCFTPDLPGTYRVKVTVTDSGGLTATATREVEVAPDHSPCLRQLTPTPALRLWVSRFDPTLVLAVNVVEDDLDPFPPAATNEAGFPRFTWSLRAPGDGALVAVPDYARSYYALDQAAFSAGDEIVVRVDVADRAAHAGATCGADDAVCPPGADPLAACVQRVTWNLEVY
ncbi:MAG TPA: hypothetical protein VGQ83_03860 [Polyangia bacterium]|jgi:hypothetical protein